MKKNYKKLMLLFVSITFIFLFLQTACSQKTDNRPTIDKAKLLAHITLKVPETKTVVSFNAVKNATVNYTAGKAPYTEHGIVKLFTNYIEPVADKGFVTFLAVDHGGSGTEIYVAGFVPDKVGYKMQGSVLLGDRVKVTALTIDQKQNVIVGYKQHAANQPMYQEPTQLVVKKIGLQILIGHL